MSDEKPHMLNRALVGNLIQRLEESHDRNLGVRQDSLKGWLNEFLEAHEHDLASLVGPHLEGIADDESLPEPVRTLFTTLRAPEHQTQFFTALFAIQGIINSFVGAALAPEVQAVASLAWAHLPILPLSPAELALATLRNNLNGLDAHNEAAKSGLDGGRFDILVANTGEPPGLQQLLELYRRNLIDDATLLKGIRQSRVRDEWAEEIKALRFAPPSPAEVLRAAVQGHLAEAVAVKKYEEGGYNPDNYDWQLATAGRPPGTMEMIELWRRGAVDKSIVESAIRESDVKNKYIPAILEMKRHVPPERTIVSGVRQGVLTDAEGRTKLGELGILEEDATWLLKEAHAVRTAAQKDLSLGVVKVLYSDGAMTHDIAVQHITGLGYDAAEAAQILGTVDMARQHRYLQAVVQRVHNLFVSYHIDKSTVTTDMDKLGIRPDERDALIVLWELEREANAKTLTLAQIQGALHRGIINEKVFREKATLLGYPKDDHDILIALAYPPTAFPHATKPPASVLA